jgi:Zn-dependent protease with chaperone function
VDGAGEAAQASATTCPRCGASLNAHEGFVTWCAACDWNIDGNGTEVATPVPVSRRQQAFEHFGDVSVQEMIAAPDLKPRRDRYALRTLLLALAVDLTSLAVLVAGVALLAWSWMRWIPVMLIGLLLVFEGVAMRPRFGKLPKGAKLASRERQPATFELLDRITDQLGAKRVDLIAVDARFNASTHQIGLRRRTLVTIGLPLWRALPPGGRLFTLGHEIAHQVNGDPTQGALVAAAFSALAEWNDVAQIQRMRVSDPTTRGANALASVVLAPVRWTTAAYSRALRRSTARARQHAELYADQLGAQVGSTEGAQELFSTLLLGPLIMWTLERAARQNDPRSFGEVERDELAQLPECERERLRRLSERAKARVDANHPPTADRVAVVSGRPRQRGTIAPSSVDWSAIDAELEAVWPDADAALRDRLRR